MTADEDDTAAIDLAIAFFSSVLVLFVFVAFNLDNDPRPEVPVSIGQSEPTREITPPAWSAVNQRGSFGILVEEGLVILDLASIAAGILDPAAAHSSDDAFQMFSPVAGAAPNAFNLTLSLDPENVPAPWRREVLSPAPDAPCPQAVRPLVTLFVLPTTADLGQIGDYAHRCGFRLRLEPREPAADGSLSLLIALRPSDYNAEWMFR